MGFFLGETDCHGALPCTPCRKYRLPFTVVYANGAAAEIPVRLLLPPAAAVCNSRNDRVWTAVENLSLRANEMSVAIRYSSSVMKISSQSC